jgi:hypothetical protein
MEAYDVMARGQARKIADAVSDTKSKSVDVPAAGGEDSDSRVPRSGRSAFPSQYHTDSYVLLGSLLCKMCSKELLWMLVERIHIASVPDCSTRRYLPTLSL